jgi:cell volume regulation protein A
MDVCVKIVSPLFFMAMFSLLILLGFLATVIFEKTGISDSLILILIGILAKKLGLLEGASLLPIAGVMASVALAIILFEAGLNLDTKNLGKNLGKALSLGSTSYFLTSFMVAGAAMFIMKWNPVNALLLGFLSGGTSAAVIIPMLSVLKMNDEDSIIMEMESTLTNIFTTVFSLMVVKLIVEASIEPSNAMTVLISSFSTGIVMGLLVGFIWLKILQLIRNRSMSYMLTLAMLFIMYAFTEFSGGNGALASLMFGIVLGNNRAITHAMNLPSVSTTRYTKLHNEISFLVRTYFFLYLGLILVFPNEINYWILAGLIGVLSFVGRGIPIQLYKMSNKFLPFINKGLSEAVIAVLLIEYAIPLAYETFTIVCMAILWTNIFSVPLLWIFNKSKHKPKEDNGKPAPESRRGAKA